MLHDMAQIGVDRDSGTFGTEYNPENGGPPRSSRRASLAPSSTREDASANRETQKQSGCNDPEANRHAGKRNGQRRTRVCLAIPTTVDALQESPTPRGLSLLHFPDTDSK